MPCFQQISPSRIVPLSLLLGLLLFLLCSIVTGEESDFGPEPEIPLEKALSFINQVCPLPSWEEGPEPDPVSTLLPSEDEEPDYELLRSLQMEEKIKEAEALANQSEADQKALNVEEFFAARENMFIRDPQRLLTTRERRQLQEILISHAGESPYNLHLNILHKESAPQILNLSDTQHQNILAGDPKGVTIFYFYDAPLKTQAHFGTALQSVIPPPLRKTFSQSALKEASSQGDFYQAAYRYILDLTLKITNYSEEQKQLQLLSEQSVETSSPSSSTSQAPPSSPLLLQLRSLLAQLQFKHLLIAGASFLLTLLLIALFLWNKFKRTYRFPIHDMPKHLGFPQGRGCSGALEFGKGSPTLKQQEKKLFQ